MRNRTKLNNLSKKQLITILIILEVLLRRIKRCNDHSDPYSGICVLLSESCRTFDKEYEWIITRLLYQNLSWYRRNFVPETNTYWYYNDKRYYIGVLHKLFIHDRNNDRRGFINASNQILSSHDWYKPRIKLINKLKRKIEKRLGILDNTY